jgi:hypothetical protein
MNVEQYKKRFYNLMESELGNVKPLVKEQDEPLPPNQFIIGDFIYEIRKEGDKFFVYRKTNNKLKVGAVFSKAADVYNNEGKGWETEEDAEKNAREYSKLMSDFNDAMEKKQTPSQQTTNQ